MRLARRWRRHFLTGAILLSLLVPATASGLPDGRAWELVSPVEKNGGGIAAPGELADGGVLQAAADGNSVTYGSAASFGAGADGAPPASQYLSTRTSSGWGTQNITAPLFSGSYGTAEEGVPYQLFSTGLEYGLLLNGKHCRGEQSSGCAVPNPPLPGTDAPAGYQNYYMRTSAGGAFEALLGASDLAGLDLAPAEFELRFAAASPDLQHVVLSTCAALTPDATEVPLGEGCDPNQPNLYEWSGSGLELVNATPGAFLIVQGPAVSSDGSRVYWYDLATVSLFLSDGGAIEQVDAGAGGEGILETATPDGSIAFFTKAGHLWRYVASTNTATDLTPAGGVVGVLGASADGTHVYYQDTGALKLWHSGTTTTVALGASAAGPESFPPSTGTSRVSADGTRLLFVSKASLTGYNNADQKTGELDSQVFIYEADTAQLRCASCRPSGTRPIGASSIPGSSPNGSVWGATNSHKPRVLSTDGKRILFESRDALVGTDTNNDLDVYQWKASGTGGCAKTAGCIDLISSGRAEGGAYFVDASTDGSSAFFITDGSLVSQDPGAFDLYVARVGGGFPNPVVPIPCNGDSCQSLPPEPVDPGLSTLFSGPGNPPVRYAKKKARKRCKRGSKQRRCVKANKGRKASKRGQR